MSYPIPVWFTQLMLPLPCSLVTGRQYIVDTKESYKKGTAMFLKGSDVASPPLFPLSICLPSQSCQLCQSYHSHTHHEYHCLGSLSLPFPFKISFCFSSSPSLSLSRQNLSVLHCPSSFKPSASHVQAWSLGLEVQETRLEHERLRA